MNDPRLPPGQVPTPKWPVLTYGEAPRLDRAAWRLRCHGLVEEEVSWTWPEFLALPRATVTSDIHCVTRWSRYDNRWEGVAMREVLARVRTRPGALSVLVHTAEGYTTNVLLEDLRDESAILATRHDGADLPPEHGGPCRLVAPKLYFWKSAKWVQAFEFLDVDAPGFWEANGYHLRGDPWKEERYSDQETDAMQRMRADAARRGPKPDR